MTNRPILFSGPMVRALLDGTKMQTRRLVKPQPGPFEGGVHPKRVARHPAPYLDAYCGEKSTPANPRGMSEDWCWWTRDDRCGDSIGKCPFGKPGDRLWVREAWGINDYRYGGKNSIPKTRPIDLASNNLVHFATKSDAGILNEITRRSSIHMPRWASRLTLIVTDVRAQRLQDISEEDARAEGATMRPKCNGRMGHLNGWSMDWSEIGKPSRFADGGVLRERDISLCDPQAAFASYWNHINGPDAWDENPWVWAVSFEVLRKNIDEVSA